MQRLALAARLFPLLARGEKTSTIRWHETQIEPGPMAYFCEDDPNKRAVVLVTRCTNMPLTEVAEFVGKAEEWPDDVMLEGMRKHYPEIELTDVVQVVEHLTPEQTAAQQ